jgi:hypothetical protein
MDIATILDAYSDGIWQDAEWHAEGDSDIDSDEENDEEEGRGAFVPNDETE